MSPGPEVERAPRGVTFLDHTADVGIEVLAATREELFRRAAVGMLRLLQGEGRAPEPLPAAGDPGPREGRRERALVLEADDLPSLLRGWLRELLWWHEVDGLAFRAVRFQRLEDTRLEASVALAPPEAEPVREIKGVTLHELGAEPHGDGWRARVIFDV